MFQQGDIVWVQFPFSDLKLKPSKIRPALVLSGKKVNKTGDYILVQITSKLRTDGLSLPIRKTDTDKPLPLKSFVRCHRLFTADESLISGKFA